MVLSETIKKLHARSAYPLQILKKLNDNAYVIDFYQDFSMSSTFNIEDLVDYKGSDFDPSNLLNDEPSLGLFLRDLPFRHFQIYYLIQWIRLIKFWMMKLSPPKMVRLVSI